MNEDMKCSERAEECKFTIERSYKYKKEDDCII
jgi:hypothetical protein